MAFPKDISLRRYDDGTPSSLSKPAVYQALYFYKKSDVLVLLTKVFCERFLPKYGDRTVDQMVQAARSVKQNIAEGITDGQTSTEVEIKLLGIARGSNLELLEDYLDYIKYHNLPLWSASNTKRYNALLDYCKPHNEIADYQPYFHSWTDEEMANTAVTLCHMVDKMLCSFILPNSTSSSPRKAASVSV